MPCRTRIRLAGLGKLRGVDVFGVTSRFGAVGVQCKRLYDLGENNQPYPGGPITLKLLKAKADKALAFSPRLDF